MCAICGIVVLSPPEEGIHQNHKQKGILTMGDIINIDEVKTIITENTEKIKYIDYISHLAQALGLTEYGISHHDAWHPSNLPAPKPLQKKQTAHQWHQESLERGYYTNNDNVHYDTSLIGTLKRRLKKFTGHENYGYGGGLDYQDVYDVTVENPLHNVFMNGVIDDDAAAALYAFLRLLGCAMLPGSDARDDAFSLLLPPLLFKDSQYHVWFGSDVPRRFKQVGAADLLPNLDGMNGMDELAIGLPVFTVQDVKNLDGGQMMCSPVGEAYRNGFENLCQRIEDNKVKAANLEQVLPLLVGKVEA